ncbi:MAG: hypothetical protein CL878_05120 [Dehalococcoidia bacterium]|nr:hypothetical protein [Dehalococcoidia bacterium]
MRMKNYFQVSLDVEGQPCLIVGGGEEATEKANRLLDAGACVTVISPEVTPQLQAWVEEGRITLEARRLALADLAATLDGVHLVINTVKRDPVLSRQLCAACVARRIPISAYDQPEHSTFVMVSLVRCGRLRVAFATGATSPALARVLRQQFEQVFDDDFAAFMEFLAQERLRIEAAMPKGHARREALRRLVRGLEVRAEIDYPPAYLDWLAAQQQESSVADESHAVAATSRGEHLPPGDAAPAVTKKVS